MYYHRDPPDDPHHPLDPIPEKWPADKPEMLPCQSTYIFYMKELLLKQIVTVKIPYW